MKAINFTSDNRQLSLYNTPGPKMNQITFSRAFRAQFPPPKKEKLETSEMRKRNKLPKQNADIMGACQGEV